MIDTSALGLPDLPLPAPTSAGSRPGTDLALPVTPPHGLIAIYTLLEDKVADFDRAADEVAEQVRANEPDTLVYVIHTVPKAPMQRIFYEVYRNRAAFERREKPAYVQRFVTARRPYVLATNVIELRLEVRQGVPAAPGRGPSRPGPGPAPGGNGQPPGGASSNLPAVRTGTSNGRSGAGNSRLRGRWAPGPRPPADVRPARAGLRTPGIPATRPRDPGYAPRDPGFAPRPPRKPRSAGRPGTGILTGRRPRASRRPRPGSAGSSPRPPS